MEKEINKKIEENTEETVKTPTEEKTSEEKKSDKSEKKVSSEKKESVARSKKFEAVAHGKSLHISKKHAMYISAFIKNKSIDQAISELNSVIALKRAVPFKGEIPHRKGKIMSGRYPINASKSFITLLKCLRGNVLFNGMDLDKTRIFTSSASWAARPVKSGGREGKRTNVIIVAKEIGVKE